MNLRSSSHAEGQTDLAEAAAAARRRDRRRAEAAEAFDAGVVARNAHELEEARMFCGLLSAEAIAQARAEVLASMLPAARARLERLSVSESASLRWMIWRRLNRRPGR